jgi:4-amino-4-deoxy-L-arabinose transferase-like glycosyltransferase
LLRATPRYVRETGALVGILCAAAVLFARELHVPPSFDEGVYLAQTDALLHGQRLGTDVFAAQPPGFHWLLLGAAQVGGLGVDQLRLAVMALALIGLVAAYSIGRALGGPAVGLAAAAVLAVTQPYPTFAAQVSADMPGTVIALAALACVMRAGRRWPWLALGGLLFAAAESVKLDAFILLLPVPIYVALRRLRLPEFGIFIGAAALALGGGAAVIGGALTAVWRGAVSYHLAARNAAGGSDNLHALRAFFHPRQPFTWLTVAALGCASVVRPRLQSPVWPFWATAAVSAAFVLWHRPLHDNHLVLLSVAFAVPVGATLAAAIPRAGHLSVPAGALLALALCAGYYQDTRQLDRNAASLPAAVRWAVATVDSTTRPDQLVVSDEPIVPFLADRRMPGSTIDTALLRFDTGYITDADVLRAVDQHDVPLVIAARAFLSRPTLLVAFERRFGPPRVRDGVRIYAKSP